MAKEAAEPEKPTATIPSRPAQSKKRRPATKRNKIARRSKKKTTSTEPAAADATAAGTKTNTQEGRVDAKPATAVPPKRKRTRKRPTSKERRRKAAGKTRPPEEGAASPTIRPMSPSAEVEQNADTIVIRFPSASPSGAGKTASDESAAETTPDQAATEPGIDRQDEDSHPETGKEQARGAEVSQPHAGEDDAAAARPKRRRRRRKKDPREAPVPESATDERSEPEDGRQRPEALTDEKPARRRGRRRGRGEKSAARPAATEQRDRATDGAAAKASKPAATSQTPASPVSKEMIINVAPQEECRIAIMENGKLQEIYLERASAENYVGNIYKGVVTNVEPSIQAAFVDFGQNKNGFLHISDLHPQYFPDGAGQTENVGRKMPRRNRPPIQRCLRRGQQLLVEVTKEGIGTKGPTLTTYLSIPGRFLVMMPGMRQLGVSRKIEDDEARRKLRSQLAELDLPDDIGFIARTAALGRTKRELQSDLSYLTRLWRAVGKRIESQKAPAEIYTESDLVIRTIRDVYTSDVARILVDDPDVAERAHEFLSVFSPRSRDTVVEYDQPEPIFHHYGIEAELERLHSRHVPLKSGGSLVIDQTEALVAIDVNSGRFRTEDDAEATAYKINIEAADEIPRQLRLRDLGGVVICDFIDMRMEKHKREIERRLNRNLKEHKERAKLLRMSEFGIIELTRQRQRASLTRSVYQDCQACHGSGLVKTAESVALDVMRLIQLAATRENVRSVEVTVSAEVAHLLQNLKRAAIHRLESKNDRSISIRTDPTFGLDQIELQCQDPRGRSVQHT